MTKYSFGCFYGAQTDGIWKYQCKCQVFRKQRPIDACSAIEIYLIRKLKKCNKRLVFTRRSLKNNWMCGYLEKYCLYKFIEKYFQISPRFCQVTQVDHCLHYNYSFILFPQMIIFLHSLINSLCSANFFLLLFLLFSCR